MRLKKLNLYQLYRGYILSFHSLSIPVEKDRRNWDLFTHKIISYWSNVGLSLGFYPWCEEERRDLGWYSNRDEDECILHLETENSPSRIKHTISKLKKSKEKYKVGIIFITDKDFTTDNLKKELKQINIGETLIISTWWNKEVDSQESGDHEQYYYLVTGHLIENGTISDLEEAECIWDKYGTLRMIFKEEPNW